MDLAIFLDKLWICFFQLKVYSRMTPRNLVSDTSSIFIPSILTPMGCGILFFVPKIIKWVLDKFRDSRFVWSQLVRAGISCLIFCSNCSSECPVAIRLVSSAKSTGF